MKGKVGDTKKTQRPLIPTGNQIGICYSIVDLGTQMVHNHFSGEDEKQRKIAISFEFPAYRAEYVEGQGEVICAHHERYKFSLHTKSNFMKMIKSWTGAAPKEGEVIDGNFLKKFLGKAAQILITHNPSKRDDIIYQNMENHPMKLDDKFRDAYVNEKLLKPTKEGGKTYITENPIRFFDLDNFDQDAFDNLNDWEKKVISESDEFKALVEKGSARAYSKEENGDRDASTAVAKAATVAKATSVNTPTTTASVSVENADEDEF